jgi:hypothetical protein
MIEDLIEYCIKGNINYRIISNNEKEKIKGYINERYLDKNRKSGRTLFDHLKINESVSADAVDSWRWLKRFFKEKKAIAFFRYDEEQYVELYDSSLFFEFYDDYAAVEFYLIDPNGEYLCGYNHSHCIFTMGTAADWLEDNEQYRNYYGYDL